LDSRVHEFFYLWRTPTARAPVSGPATSTEQPFRRASFFTRRDDAPRRRNVRRNLECECRADSDNAWLNREASKSEAAHQVQTRIAVSVRAFVE
jgi:hypothetical protein